MKEAKPMHAGYWWFTCPYCDEDNKTFDGKPINKGRKIECDNCKKTFISGGWEISNL